MDNNDVADREELKLRLEKTACGFADRIRNHHQRERSVE
jgi:hypothetical protein